MNNKSQSKGPLAGIKVLEFAGLAPAPFCGMILSDFGAEVIRVDRFGTSGQDRLTRGKKSISIDLKKQSGIDLVLSLIEKVDVVLEPFRPGVAERLGFGPEVALKKNPKVIYARLTGWGQTGPLSNAVGHDINYIAISGALSRIGRQGEKPLFPTNYLADFAGGGLLCAFGIVMALLERSKSGRGQVIDSAMVDGVAYLSAFLFSHYNQGMWKLERGANALDSGAHFYEVYETKDNKYVAVGAIEPPFYAALLKGLGLHGDPTLPQQLDISEWPAMKSKFSQVFRTKTREEWGEIFKNTDACVSPVIDIDEVMKDPHNASRQVYVENSAKQWMPAPAPRLSRTPAEGVYTDEPLQAGQHSVSVLKDAGMSSQQIQQLLKEKVVFQADLKASL